jgi:hypothetical protein
VHRFATNGKMIAPDPQFVGAGQKPKSKFVGFRAS